MVDMFDERRKAHEVEYFHKKETELLEKLRKRYAEQTRLAALKGTFGEADETVLRTFEELGFSRESVVLLHLMPLVQVAWSDGSISKRERELVEQAASLRGVKPGTDEAKALERLLTQRPSDAVFAAALRAIKVMVEAMPADEQATVRKDLSSYASQVAVASGGFLGMGHSVSDEEKGVLEQLARELNSTKGAAAANALTDVTKPR